MNYSIVLPCKNEESTLATCINKIRKVLPNSEIIVVDNNSKDNSALIAKKLKVKLIKEKKQGYGAALLAGFKEASGNYIIMCDSDDTYDLLEIPKLIKYRNYDLVIGNRFGNMKKGAMPFLHKYIGNPFLSYLLRKFFKINVRDAHCGFRLIKKKALDKLKLKTSGMEIASEMLIKASKNKLKIKEVPITYYPRKGESKLNSFKDGWKHLRFMLLYSPSYLFLIPGLFLFGFGFFMMLLLLNGPLEVAKLRLDIHPMIIGSLFTIVGYQIILLWLYAKTYAIHYLNEKDRLINIINKIINLERGIFLGVILFILGLILNINILVEWINSGFGSLSELRTAVFAFTLVVLGIQTIFSSFFLSILGLRK
jgi:glycosyltransferase involved in cell wall biosynthesis